MCDFNFKTHDFEGPLSLLLYLIKKNKLNIFDIEISILLEQYLNFINEAHSLDLELSSEFLEVAATLIFIKTASLLPKDQEEEAKKLKEELTGKLIELDLIKSVSHVLSYNCVYGRIYTRDMPKKELSPYNFKHSLCELTSSLEYLKTKIERLAPPCKDSFIPIVKTKLVSVASRVVFILKKLYNKGSAPLNDFYDGMDKSYCVATFLAILELVKSGRIELSNDNQTLIFRRQI